MTDPSYIIKPVSGKGMGAFATRPITYGDVILSEAPLFTQTLVQCGVRTIALALSSKSDSEKRQYLELANCHQGRYPPLMGIFRTNALPCGDNGTRKIATKAGIFLKATRFNSSCVPNVNNWWNEGKNVIEFRALRDIAQGEELSITYAVDLSPWADRRRELQVRYGFECHCEACSLSGEALTASDDRRIKLESLIDEIGECGNRPAEGIRKAIMALRLSREEGLVQYTETFCYDAFQFCVVVSDLEHAKAWIKKTYRAVTCSRGPTAAQYYETYLKNPKQHPSWGKGRKMVLVGPEE